MAIDQIVTRRFAELSTKAEAISKDKKHEFTSEKGEPHYSVSSGPFKEWATNVLSLLQRTFGKESVHYEKFEEEYSNFLKWESQFENCRSIFKAAREDYEGGYLFNVRALAKAEVLSNAISQANDLLKAGYKDPACILARVALDVTLKELSSKHGTPVGTLDRMNAELCKVGAYNMVKQKQITAFADIGNKAAHGEWGTYSETDARAMVQGVEVLVADLL